MTSRIKGVGEYVFVDGWTEPVWVPDRMLSEDSVNYKLRPCCGFSGSFAVETEDGDGTRRVIGWLPCELARMWREPGRPVGGCPTVKDWMERSAYVIETQTAAVVAERKRRTTGC